MKNYRMLSLLGSIAALATSSQASTPIEPISKAYQLQKTRAYLMPTISSKISNNLGNKPFLNQRQKRKNHRRALAAGF